MIGPVTHALEICVDIKLCGAIPAVTVIPVMSIQLAPTQSNLFPRPRNIVLLQQPH